MKDFDWFSAIAFVIAAFCFYCMFYADYDCSKRGGTMIQGAIWYECVKLEKVE